MKVNQPISCIHSSSIDDHMYVCLFREKNIDKDRRERLKKKKGEGGEKLLSMCFKWLEKKELTF